MAALLLGNSNYAHKIAVDREMTAVPNIRGICILEYIREYIVIDSFNITSERRYVVTTFAMML